MYILMENKWEDMRIVTQLDKSLVRFGKFTGDISKPTRARVAPPFFRPPPCQFCEILFGVAGSDSSEDVGGPEWSGPFGGAACTVAWSRGRPPL